MWSPDGSRIAFRSDRPAGPEGRRSYLWYLINRDGTGPRLFMPVGNSGLRWSPDGSRVAIFDAQTIILANADATAARGLSQNAEPTAPVWSADGRRLAYRETRGPLTSIFSLDVTDGSAPIPVARATTALGAPVLSPDGRRIAYTQPNEGTFIVDATQAGTTPERLPSQPFTPTAWSADGRLLMGIRPATAGQPAAPMLYDSGTRAFEVLAERGAGGQWAPDGSRVVVNEAGARLQVVDRATKTVHELFSVTPPATISYALDPNGRALLFTASELQADIYRIRVP